MTDITRAPIEFVAADRIIERPAPRPAKPQHEATDTAAADFTERRCERFINADVAR